MQPSKYDSDFCGSLPLNLTNLIQPYGILLVVDRQSFEIIQASENTEPVFGKSVTDVVGQSLSAFISQGDEKNLQRKLKIDPINKIPALWSIRDKRYVVMVHPKEQYLLVELDGKPQTNREEDAFVSIYQELKYTMTAIETAESLEKACEIAARELKRISGFDKVMIYRFDPDWNGYVMAEAKEDDMESYFQFTFPASDIPRQARLLYLKNAYRFIPDRAYKPVKLYPVVNPILGSFIDLSDCNLRSVAAVHLEYLKNMGVVASMSTRILFGDGLWGLIACHHKTARHMSYEMCSVFEMLSGIISMKITSLQNHTASLRQNFITRTWASIVESIYKSEDLYTILLASDGVLKLFNASGAVLTKGSRFTTCGETPPDDSFEELLLWLHTKEIKRCFSTNSLRRDYEYANAFNGRASGMLVVPINPQRDEYLILFRPEIVRVITWGGNPADRIQFDKDERNYHPRNSFKQWKEKVSGISQPWTDEELNAAETLRSFIYEYETAPAGNV